MAALEQLSEINHDSMVAADGRAKRLSATGAWAAVLLGMAAFLVSVRVVRALHRRIVAPIRELFETVDGWRRGGCTADAVSRVWSPSSHPSPPPSMTCSINA